MESEVFHQGPMKITATHAVGRVRARVRHGNGGIVYDTLTPEDAHAAGLALIAAATEALAWRRLHHAGTHVQVPGAGNVVEVLVEPGVWSACAVMAASAEHLTVEDLTGRTYLVPLAGDQWRWPAGGGAQ